MLDLQQQPETARPAYVPTSAGSKIRVEDYLGLVRKIAWHVHSGSSKGIDINDLVQTGVVALMEAAQTYEVRADASFATYATIRVRGAMIDYLRRQAHVCRSGMIKAKRMGKVSRSLEQELGRPASRAELAAALEITVDQLDRDQDVARGVTYESLDEIYSDHALWFADVTDSPGTHLERVQLQQKLSSSIARLTEREAQVLQLYFVEEMNLHEIGAILGIKAARVCQIKKSALDSLRDDFRETD
jgi:RNA polymerase sigma factor for flagellar operon FliA